MFVEQGGNVQPIEHSKIGECQRKAIAPASSTSQVLSHDNGLPPGWCSHCSWFLPRYRLFTSPGALTLTRTRLQGSSLCVSPSTIASCMSKLHQKPLGMPRTFTPSFTTPRPPSRWGPPLCAAALSLTIRIKGLPSLDDGNWHHLFVGKAS